MRTTFKVGFAVLLATVFLAFEPAQKGQAYTCTSKQCSCNGSRDCNSMTSKACSGGVTCSSGSIRCTCSVKGKGPTLKSK